MVQSGVCFHRIHVPLVFIYWMEGPVGTNFRNRPLELLEIMSVASAACFLDALPPCQVHGYIFQTLRWVKWLSPGRPEDQSVKANALVSSSHVSCRPCT